MHSIFFSCRFYVCVCVCVYIYIYIYILFFIFRCYIPFPVMQLTAPLANPEYRVCLRLCVLG